MMEVIVEVCRAFALTVSAKKKTETMYVYVSTAYNADDGVSRSSRANLQKCAILHLPRGAVTETPDVSVEIARQTRACWMRIRRYLRDLYDQPKVALSLKTRMLKAEAIETLLYGCSTWTLPQEHYAKLRTVHHRVLLRSSGHSARDQTTV